MRTRTPRISGTTIGLLGLGVLLLSYSTLTASPGVMAQIASQMVASAVVSMSAGVEENQDNRLALQFAAKEAELQDRESRLVMQEQMPPRVDSTALYSFAASMALFVLVALNFFFDWRRGYRARSPSVVA